MSAIAPENTEIQETAIAAYRLASNGTITDVYPWQILLYERLSARDKDAGYLLDTQTGIGKSEAVVIPSAGLHRGGAPRRLFIISADGSPLDDHILRFGWYLQRWASADGVPRTMFVDSDEEETDGYAIRYSSDGTVESELSISPLEADVDLVLTTLGRFENLFFGGGGVHVLPSSLSLMDEEPIRRDLFFFDEAHKYSTDDFRRFQRLIEFLFAEDTDIIVGSSTMPLAFQEELIFLEKITVPDFLYHSTLEYRNDITTTEDTLRIIKEHYTGTERIALIVSNEEEVENVLAGIEGVVSSSIVRYDTSLNPDERREIYAKILEANNRKEPFLLITTGVYLESANIDTDILITPLCLPENLILRAGRCNRFGHTNNSKLIVTGTSIEPSIRTMNPTQFNGYTEYLRGQSGSHFIANDYRRFI